MELIHIKESRERWKSAAYRDSLSPDKSYKCHDCKQDIYKISYNKEVIIGYKKGGCFTENGN